jgi:hypothetical protein
MWRAKKTAHSVPTRGITRNAAGQQVPFIIGASFTYRDQMVNRIGIPTAILTKVGVTNEDPFTYLAPCSVIAITKASTCHQ